MRINGGDRHDPGDHHVCRARDPGRGLCRDHDPGPARDHDYHNADGHNSASAVVKVPQIIKLVSSKSASGVSFLSYLLETGSLLTSLAYNYRKEFPISTYGESALILGQNVIITVLLLNYSGKPGLAAES